eukprot:326935_1
MDCSGCNLKYAINTGYHFPFCDDCGKPYCSPECLQSHRKKHVNSNECENRKTRQFIILAGQSLRTNYKWKFQEVVVIAISAVTYFVQDELVTCKRDRELIYDTYGPYGMNWFLFRTKSDVVGARLVDSIVQDVEEFIDEKKHIDGTFIFCSGHGSPGTFHTSDGVDILVVDIIDTLAKRIKAVMGYITPFVTSELFCQGTAAPAIESRDIFQDQNELKDDNKSNHNQNDENKNNINDNSNISDIKLMKIDGIGRDLKGEGNAIDNDKQHKEMKREYQSIFQNKMKSMNVKAKNIRVTQAVCGNYLYSAGCDAQLLCEWEYTMNAIRNEGAFEYFERFKAVTHAVQHRTHSWYFPIMHAPLYRPIGKFICLPYEGDSLEVVYYDEDFDETGKKALAIVRELMAKENYEELFYQLMEDLNVDCNELMKVMLDNYKFSDKGIDFIKRKVRQIKEKREWTPDPDSEATESDEETKDAIEQSKHENESIYDDIVSNKTSVNKKGMSSKKKQSKKTIVMDNDGDDSKQPNDEDRYVRLEKTHASTLKKTLNNETIGINTFHQRYLILQEEDNKFQAIHKQVAIYLYSDSIVNNDNENAYLLYFEEQVEMQTEKLEKRYQEIKENGQKRCGGLCGVDGCKRSLIRGRDYYELPRVVEHVIESLKSAPLECWHCRNEYYSPRMFHAHTQNSTTHQKTIVKNIQKQHIDAKKREQYDNDNDNDNDLCMDKKDGEVNEKVECFFVYGILRDDDDSGALSTVQWRSGCNAMNGNYKLMGYKMYKKKNLNYPFAIKSNNDKDFIVGRIISFNDSKIF